jgi:hypothetical protein
MTTTKNYLTVSGGTGRSKLYLLNKRTEGKFKKEFPDFETLKFNDDKWSLALTWLEKNAKFVSLVECYCY